ncbi:tail fibers protein [Ralstonia phage RS-PI-1]|uniref:Tail fibers protein n=1 Tax=Ralstonia phage RS-PI-1 TaxID=1958965 RepID=A0A1S6L1B2_9CAUD|nr:tail fibers protein [Ralstonia phage RS-PI-1]AQT27776.1 tail fibers protein [Ralstonia phage RS-PI-1]
MGKVTGSYASITRGVSEQVPQDRHPGQHFEQVNMVSDPVKGLVRRHGSITMDERPVTGMSPSPNLTPTQQAYARNYREYSFFVGGTEYAIIYMSRERNSGDTMPFCFVLNKATGKFLTVAYADQANLQDWIFGGISAITTVGKYVVMASNRIGPGYSVDDQYARSSQQWVATVRGGAYSRTYRLTVRRASDGVQFIAAYTTMASSYPNLLNTSDISLEGNPNYQKQVNDRVNDYNSRVNQWIGDAAKSITPEFIAAQLSASLANQGYTNQYAIGGTIVGDNSSSVGADDGGDGAMFRAVYNEVDDPSKLSPIHAVNKVVRVRPKGAPDPYYMIAVGDNPTAGPWQTVTWKETAAQVVQPGQVFAIGAVSNDGTTFYLASNAAALQAAIGGTVPGYAKSVCGDLNAEGAVPYFFGKRVTLLTVFMDRLVVVANGTVFMSRTGDYFNFFRKSMLTVNDDDPIEVYALGAEDDIISKCVTYNKDLFMFGVRKQYTISGRAVLTPKSASVSTAANEQDAMYAQPVVVGNLLYYGKYEDARNQVGPSPYAGRINQFQLGLFQDSPETYCVSQQLSRYIRGRPIEFATLSAPSCLIVRTDGYDNGLYVYSFIDQPGTQSRVFDAWSRWEWSSNVGRVIGLTTYEASIYAFVLRYDGSSVYVACEQFYMDSDLSVNPYLDAQRPAAQFAADTGYINRRNVAVIGDGATALANTVDRAWLGEFNKNFDDFWNRLDSDERNAGYTGIAFDSYVTLTPPFVRDNNGKALINGRLVVGRYSVSVSDTGGLDAYLLFSGDTSHVFSFNGRRVGLSNNQVGRQPITSAALQIPAGRSNTEHTMSFHSRKWLPMALTAIEWVGQLFLNSRRV